MLFNSLSFSVFLPIVFCVYWSLPHKYRWFCLLLASYYFYMSWNAKYIILILFTTLVAYITAITLESIENSKTKKLTTFMASFLCLSTLVYFKYFNFLSQSLTSFLECFLIQLHPITVDVLLPVGISFYTFQTLSYVIDVYKGRVKAEKHLGYFALFVSFFPQLVAGPIERTYNLLPQIKLERRFDYCQATYGTKLMAWGFFKKLVIADFLSKYVSLVFGNPTYYHGFALALASFLFTIQIYCDFSGYSDIAVGTAKLFGIDLMRNFNSPYLSSSIKQFWQRWHVSLSTWFRDYVYIPLGGSKVSIVRHDFNLLLTFLISGLWHGANWTFVLWGGVHGVGLIIENHFDRFIKNNLNYLKCDSFTLKCVKILTVFCFCSFAWIFFVSKSLSDALWIVSHMFDGLLVKPSVYFTEGIVSLGLDYYRLIYLVTVLVILLVYDELSLKFDVIEAIGKTKFSFRWIIYFSLVFFIISSFYLGLSDYGEFIYFRF